MAKSASPTMPRAEELIKRYDSLKSARSTWEDHWQDLADYCLPRKAEISTTKTEGQKFSATLYDSTAVWALQVFAAGLHSYLTNPSTKWFELGLKNEEDETDDVKKTLKDAEDQIFRTLNSSNFNEQIHEVYLDLGCFGTAFLYEEESVEETVRFYARPIGEIFIEENAEGRIKTVFRAFRYTVKQAYEKWGEAAGELVKKHYENKDFNKKLDFLHVIEPRDVRDVRKEDKENKPYASCWLEYSKKHMISEGGYEEFPFMCPRYTKKSGEVYGYSNSMIVLSDIKMINAMSETIIKASQKMVAPPLQGPHDGYILPLDTSPDAINYYLAGTQQRFEPLYDPRLHNIPIANEMLIQRREAILKAFYADLFLLLAQSKNMTATEVVERVQEKMLILAPVLGRLMNELLQPIIERTFAILVRNGIIELPEEMQDMDYAIRYISPLARAQKLSESKQINEFLISLTGMINMNPEVIDNFDFDKMARKSADIYNISPEMIRSKEELKQIREQRAEAQAQQAQLETALALAKGAKDAGISLGGNNANAAPAAKG